MNVRIIFSSFFLLEASTRYTVYSTGFLFYFLWSFVKVFTLRQYNGDCMQKLIIRVVSKINRICAVSFSRKKTIQTMPSSTPLLRDPLGPTCVHVEFYMPINMHELYLHFYRQYDISGGRDRKLLVVVGLKLPSHGGVLLHQRCRMSSSGVADDDFS